MDIQFFMDISLQLPILLWISIWISLDFYGYPCIDLPWILDPGDFPQHSEQYNIITSLVKEYLLREKYFRVGEHAVFRAFVRRDFFTNNSLNLSATMLKRLHLLAKEYD